MDWSEIKLRYRALVEARDGSGDLDAAWEAFSSVCRRAPVPYHLSLILKHLEDVRGDRPAADLNILDHGCGGALSILYLAARGYVGVYGVDIGGLCERWNSVLRRKVGAQDQRIFTYDGANLPFPDDMFDFVFSQEVVEHIRPNRLEGYYADEARVMKPGAVAFHRVPHRLVPFDSHTNTWFIHYLPRVMWLAALRWIGRDLTTAKTAIFLRWPWVHRRLARKHLGSCEDFSILRFKGVEDLSQYEGPRKLRSIAGRVLKLPVVGPLSGKMLGNFIMLDTVSRRPPA